MISKDALLAAHIQYELQQYAPDRLEPVLREEMVALYAWLGTVNVSELLQPDIVTAWIQRNVLERPLPAEVIDFLKENIIVALELVQDDQSRVQDLLPKAVFDRAVDSIASMQALREQIVHQVVTSSLYSRLLANVLYHGIKTFLVTENGMARSIPGASALLRLSQNALNATAPQMEKNVDKQLVAFIDDNIQQTITDSEAFLNRSLNEELLHKVGEELWDSAADETLAHFSRSLDKEALVAWVDVVEQSWLHLRQTELMHDIVQAVVRSFFLRYGKQDMRALLEQMGLSEEAVLPEAMVVVAPLAERALASGYLEQRIRSRLEPFYTQYFAGQQHTEAETRESNA